MKNLKKIALLLSILTVFAISCKDAQKAVSSTFDVITDDPTSVPDNPPAQTTTGKEFPADFDFTTKNLYFEPSSKWDTYLTVNVNKGTDLNGKTLKYDHYSTFVEYTSGISNPKAVLSALGTIRQNVNSFLQIPVSGSLHAAMGSGGQRAKIKYEVYITPDGGEYKTGIRTLYIELYRRY